VIGGQSVTDTMGMSVDELRHWYGVFKTNEEFMIRRK
jgi:hypothetical protein